jgi:hypothetical protein
MTDPKHLYLEVSKFKADNGQLTGRLPEEISLHDLRALGHPESPFKAIRAQCIELQRRK